jgi:hypothetical protein
VTLYQFDRDIPDRTVAIVVVTDRQMKILVITDMELRRLPASRAFVCEPARLERPK